MKEKENIINTEAFTRMLFDELNHSMTEAAEPIIQKAMKEIEEEMRKNLAMNLLAKIQNDFAVDRMQNDIRIIVRQALPGGE